MKRIDITAELLETEALVCVECKAPAIVGTVFYRCQDNRPALNDNGDHDGRFRDCEQVTCDSPGCRGRHAEQHEAERARVVKVEAPHDAA